MLCALSQLKNRELEINQIRGEAVIPEQQIHAATKNLICTSEQRDAKKWKI